MIVEFDKRLVAMADCPVIPDKDGGALFNPFPLICAPDSDVLAHEVCHILAGRDSYYMFDTAVVARDDDEGFRFILNLLFDWYDEHEYGKYSGVLMSALDRLHAGYKPELTKIKPLDNIIKMYTDRDISPKSVGIEDTVDLIAYADSIYNKIRKNKLSLFRLRSMFKKGRMRLITGQNGGKKNGKGASPGYDIGVAPARSDYYKKTVSKYWDTIRELSSLWKRNRYDWLLYYFGEINWRNLPGLFFGDKISLPVFRLFSKIAVARSIYLVVDRSSSTHKIRETIMDTAIIITESLRSLGVPISVLEVGAVNGMVNDIDEDLDLKWFTPMDDNGTPLGEVCHMIKKADKDSYLLIITDGIPDSWEDLISALHKFPGSHLTFVIGDAYAEYAATIGNSIQVEPNTIIREMLNDPHLA